MKETLNKAKQDSKKISSASELLDFITWLHTELDIIHPFREGNGRCEREFIRQYMDYICKNNNLDEYYLDYSLINDKNLFINYVILADSGKDEYLRKLFSKILVTKEKNKKR